MSLQQTPSACLGPCTPGSFAGYTFREFGLYLKYQTAGEVEGCSITGAGRTELAAAAASADIGINSESR